MGLAERRTSRWATSVGVENTQPPVSNYQRTGSWGFAGGSGCWAATRPGRSRTTAKTNFRTFTGTSNRKRTFLFRLYFWLTILSEPKNGQAWGLRGNWLQARLMRVRACPLTRVFQGFVQAVQLILQPIEFRLFHPQSIFGNSYRCLDFSLFIRVGIEPCFYLGEGIFKVLLFRCRSLTGTFLLLDLFDRGRTDVLLEPNLSEPSSGFIYTRLHS